MSVTGFGIDDQAQVQRILDSETFRNKESLRRLLLYLLERTSDGTAGSLKEYSIGVDVLGKPETYDPQVDPSARVLAGKLRQKLKDYYAAEGVNDALLVELPRRHFGLLFHPVRQETAAASVSSELPPIPYPPSTDEFHWRVWALGLACFALGIATSALYLSRRGADAIPTSSSLREFWRPMLESRRPALVCFGTPLFVRFYGARLRLPVDDFEELKDAEAVRALQKVFPQAKPQPSHIFTGVGEAAGGFLLSRLFTQLQKDVSWRRNSALSWDDIRSNDLIFLGSARYNTHLRALPLEGAFRVEGGGVTNVHPQPGEPAKYQRVYSPGEQRDILEDYAVVSRLPGLNGHGEMVVLGSSSTEGTLGAVEYVTDGRHLDDLSMHVGELGHFPQHFESVIRVRFRDMVPVESSWVTHRVIQNSP